MAAHFNINEIFEMAERIEKNGAKFYRKAAEIFSKDKTTEKLMLELASMEEEHRIIYAAMKAQLTKGEEETTTFDPDDQVKAFLNAIADRSVFDKDPSTLLTGKETLKEVIQMAINSEKDSIIFYLGLKDMLPERSGREKIEHVIEEEKRHIVLLTNMK